jgi:hypothetical protein
LGIAVDDGLPQRCALGDQVLRGDAGVDVDRLLHARGTAGAVEPGGERAGQGCQREVRWYASRELGEGGVDGAAILMGEHDSEPGTERCHGKPESGGDRDIDVVPG